MFAQKEDSGMLLNVSSVLLVNFMPTAAATALPEHSSTEFNAPSKVSTSVSESQTRTGTEPTASVSPVSQPLATHATAMVSSWAIIANDVPPNQTQSSPTESVSVTTVSSILTVSVPSRLSPALNAMSEPTSILNCKNVCHARMGV